MKLNNKTPWSEEETEFLKNNFHKMPHRELSEKLDRTVAAVRGRFYSQFPEPLEKPKPITKKVWGYVMRFDGRNWKQIGTI